MDYEHSLNAFSAEKKKQQNFTIFQLKNKRKKLTVANDCANAPRMTNSQH